jgi:hypothetical protein
MCTSKCSDMYEAEDASCVNAIYTIILSLISSLHSIRIHAAFHLFLLTLVGSRLLGFVVWMKRISINIRSVHSFSLVIFFRCVYLPALYPYIPLSLHIQVLAIMCACTRSFQSCMILKSPRSVTSLNWLGNRLDWQQATWACR